MRQIEISTDVFAALWALRQPGEETEDEILRRLLVAGDAYDRLEQSGVGFRDARFGLVLPNGFRISRTFKGRAVEAIARNGSWYLAGSAEPLRSLNELSRALGAGPENAWRNWFFFDQDGSRRSIAELRQSGVRVRPKQETPNSKEARMAQWISDVVEALTDIGGEGSLATIYDAARRVRARHSRSRAPSLDAIVRRTLEENCAETASYKYKLDLFHMPKGHGAGYWALKQK